MKLEALKLWRSVMTGRVYAGFVQGNCATSKVDVTAQFDALALPTHTDWQAVAIHLDHILRNATTLTLASAGQAPDSLVAFFERTPTFAAIVAEHRAILAAPPAEAPNAE